MAWLFTLWENPVLLWLNVKRLNLHCYEEVAKKLLINYLNWLELFSFANSIYRYVWFRWKPNSYAFTCLERALITILDFFAGSALFCQSVNCKGLKAQVQGQVVYSKYPMVLICHHVPINCTICDLLIFMTLQHSFQQLTYKATHTPMNQHSHHTLTSLVRHFTLPVHKSLPLNMVKLISLMFQQYSMHIEHEAMQHKSPCHFKNTMRIQDRCC